MVHHLPWKAAVTCEAVFGTGVVVVTVMGVQTGEGAVVDQKAAVFLE